MIVRDGVRGETTGELQQRSAGTVREGGRIRLLVVGCRWPLETFLERMFRGLCTAGVDVTLATHARPSAEWLSHRGAGWRPTHVWKGPLPRRLTQVGRQFASAAVRAPNDVHRIRSAFAGTTWKRTLREWHRVLPLLGRKHDAIYIPWNSAAVEYAPLFELGLPVILSCRGSQVMSAPHNPHRAAFRDQLEETFQRAAAVHCVSDALAREALQFGLEPGKLRVIPPAVDTEYFRPADSKPTGGRPFRVVTVGSLVWQKGHEYALAAVRRAVDLGIDLHFDIVGDGADAQRALYAVHDLALTGRVQLHGQLPPEKVRDLLWRSDAFLLSSVTEGISNAAIEAMACGLPVVTTDCGGMPEAVTDGVEGDVVPVRESAALADALVRMAREPRRRIALGHAARLRALRDFGISQQVSRWHTLLCDVVAAAATPGGGQVTCALDNTVQEG